MRRKRQYIVLSFASTARAMGWEKECAARGIPGRLIPLPSEITAGCGLAWCADLSAREEITAMMQEAGIEPEDLHECIV